MHLERDRYLQGEPIVVVVDILNAGDEAVGYSTCDGDVSLTVIGVERRVPPNIFGCFSGTAVGGEGCGTDHLPLLATGQSTSFKYLLKKYNLKPGQYRLTVSGKAGVRWRETAPVPGAQFEHTLSLNIVPAAEEDLKRACAPLVSGADAADPVRRPRRGRRLSRVRLGFSNP